MGRRQQGSFARSNRKVHLNKKRFFCFIAAAVIVICGLAFTTKILIEKLSLSDSQEQLSNTVQMEQGGKMMLAARAYVYSGLTYDPSYFGGYPPKDRGVCTDVVWEGLMGANIVLKDLVDEDIMRNFDEYSSVIEVADPGIDFRNVPVLEVYLNRHSDKLTDNVSNILAWQPGDIVVFESKHIAVVSCTRNIFGEPYIIQHGKDPAADEDRINASDGMEISGHFRWRGNSINFDS